MRTSKETEKGRKGRTRSDDVVLGSVLALLDLVHDLLHARDLDEMDSDEIALRGSQDSSSEG